MEAVATAREDPIASSTPNYSHSCMTCRVVFSHSELQREHYKSDWHRYNLKRKVADLPAVTAQVFTNKVTNFRIEAEIAANADGSVHRCKVCQKNFANVKSMENHFNSKKHLELESKFASGKSPNDGQVGEGTEGKTPTGPEESTDLKNLNKSPRLDLDRKNASIKQTAGGQQSSGDVSMKVSNDDSDEDSSSDWDEDEDAGLGLEECLFCSIASGDMAENIRHMYVTHGFFIPDVEYCSNLEGLLTYLGQKVGAGMMCLWCNERGRQFRTTDAVQKHMRDKCHCKMAHDGDAMLEYEDFFDFSSSYPAGKQLPEDGEIELGDAAADLLADANWQLVLPSGNTLGHRSLQRYFRQKLKPEKQIIARGKTGSNVSSIVAQYRHLGWTGVADPKAAQQRAKDVAFMHKIQSRQRLRIGIKHNKFQPHFRRDDFDH